jgi:TrmH family RNA methyltransferase
MSSFSKVKIILLETSHPGNIGSVARAMKTMGFSNLNLVDPKCEVNEISYAMASNAGDVLDNLKVYKDINEALSECNFIVGATARQRDIPLEIINPRELAAQAKHKSYEKIAILLGNEARGLTNEQLSLCTIGLHIPSNKQYTSLNIAASLQVILYEMLYESEYNASNINKINKNDKASNKMLNGFLQHMNKVLKDINFIKDDRPMISRKIHHIFKKADLSEEEINILRGILSAIENHSQ